MGEVQDVIEFARKTFHVTGDAAKAIRVAEGAITAVMGVTMVIGVVDTIVDAFFDDVDETGERIKDLGRQFRAVMASSGAIAQMRDVGEQIGRARARASDLRSSLPEGPDPPLRSDLLTDSSDVVEILGDENFWLRSFFTECVYRDAWVGDLTPDRVALETGASAVFDWRLTLPAYLEAIAIRLVILSAVFPDYRTRHREHLLRIARRLTEYHNTISDGIRTHRPPIITELISSLTEDVHGVPPRVNPNFWDLWERKFGAVEVYSARSAVSVYPPDPNIDLPPNHAPTSDQYRLFMMQHGLRSLYRWKEIYSACGLQEVARIINQLRWLVGEQPAVKNGGQWSVAEIDQVVGGTLGASNRLSDGSLSLRLLLQRIEPGTSLRQACESWYVAH